MSLSSWSSIPDLRVELRNAFLRGDGNKRWLTISILLGGPEAEEVSDWWAAHRDPGDLVGPWCSVAEDPAAQLPTLPWLAQTLHARDARRSILGGLWVAWHLELAERSGGTDHALSMLADLAAQDVGVAAVGKLSPELRSAAYESWIAAEPRYDDLSWRALLYQTLKEPRSRARLLSPDGPPLDRRLLAVAFRGWAATDVVAWFGEHTDRLEEARRTLALPLELYGDDDARALVDPMLAHLEAERVQRQHAEAAAELIAPELEAGRDLIWVYIQTRSKRGWWGWTFVRDHPVRVRLPDRLADDTPPGGGCWMRITRWRRARLLFASRRAIPERPPPPEHAIGPRDLPQWPAPPADLHLAMEVVFRCSALADLHPLLVDAPAQVPGWRMWVTHQPDAAVAWAKEQPIDSFPAHQLARWLDRHPECRRPHLDWLHRLFEHGPRVSRRRALRLVAEAHDEAWLRRYHADPELAPTVLVCLADRGAASLADVECELGRLLVEERAIAFDLALRDDLPRALAWYAGPPSKRSRRRPTEAERLWATGQQDAYRAVLTRALQKGASELEGCDLSVVRPPWPGDPNPVWRAGGPR